MLHRRHHWLFILPALLFVLLLTLYPSVHTVLLSFTNRSLVERGASFVGWKNYRELLFSHDFWSSLRVTLAYVLATILLQLSLGLALALLTDRPRPGAKLVRALVLICWVIPEVIVALTFKWMFIGDRYGLVNAFLLQTGLARAPVKWLSTGGLALLLAIGMTVWRGTAFSMIMQAAALKGVPEELYEAAEIDGAGRLQKFARITLPLIRSTVLINLIIISIATFNVMSLVYAFSGGGPFRTTEVISIYMYKTAFKFFRFGYASALSVAMFLLNILFTVVYIRVTRKDFLE